MRWRPEARDSWRSALALLLGLVGLGDAGCSCQPANAPCATTAECLADEICFAGQCRTICNATSDCSGSESCRDGMCMQLERLCQTDAECLGIERCVEHLCRLRCAAVDDCASGEVCLGGACVPGRDAGAVDTRADARGDSGQGDQTRIDAPRPDRWTGDRGPADTAVPDQAPPDVRHDAAAATDASDAAIANDASDAAIAVDGASADASPVTSCVGRADFELCVGGTDSLSYHICIDGQCLAPGCGSASCNTPGPHFRLADTDQRSCFNGSTDLACSSNAGSESCSSTAFCGQDGQYGWDTQHLASERFERLAPVGDQYVVRDHVTLLMWQGCQYLRSGITCGTGNGNDMTWSNAVIACDQLDWGGHDDWYLPDSHELQSIVDYGNNGPAIDTALFPNTGTIHYWTSATLSGSESDAWAIDFTNGEIAPTAKGSTRNLRCVRRDRAEPRPAVRWTIELIGSERVVSDAVTGLAWQGCLTGLAGELCDVGAATPQTWSQALATCEDLTWGGRSDWRLPNVKELHSINDFRGHAPSLATAIFPNPLPGSPAYSWTATTNRGNKGQAWQCGANTGTAITASKTVLDQVRCVRDLP